MSRRTGRLLSATLAAGLVLSMGGAALAAPATGALKQFKVPTANSEPLGITNGADGNRWFTEGTSFTNAPPRFGRVTPAGKITEFDVLCNSCILQDIAQGSDGILYATSNGSDLVRLDVNTPGTPLTALTIPGRDPDTTTGSAGEIVAHGTDVWFIADRNRLVRYDTTNGEFTSLPLAFGASDLAIDDRGAWLTADVDHNVNQVDTGTGALIDSFATGDLVPRAITIATDGQVWFTSEFPAEGVGRLDPTTRVVTPFLTSNTTPLDIAAGPGGAIWFTQSQKGNIARIDNSGTIAETKVVKGNDPTQIVVASNGDPWFTMRAANKIGAFVAK